MKPTNKKIANAALMKGGNGQKSFSIDLVAIATKPKANKPRKQSKEQRPPFWGLF